MFGLVKSKIRSYLCRVLGLEELERNVCSRLDTLDYFLNELIDISSIPPTKNADLRIMQKCDALLLALFDSMCKKNHLVYWLDYGTLLGAVRHKGFIPWDDDMDVAMPREDFNRLEDILKKELSPLGIEVYPRPSGPALGIAYQHFNTGIWLDVFPVDTYPSSQKLTNSQTELKRKASQYQDYYFAKKDTGLTLSDFDSYRRSFLSEDGQEQVVYHCLEYSHDECLLYEEQDIYPLVNVEFEGMSFPAPSQYHSYLKLMFGDYMSFPKSGVLIHDMGRGNLHTWAKKNGTDMKEVEKQLSTILNTYSC